MDPQSLTLEEARPLFEQLQDELRAADLAYHQKDAPEISDADYDAKKRQYRALAEAFPDLAAEATELDTVGAPVASGFGKITHAQRMMSLGNAFDDDDVADFDKGLRKYLGLSASEPLAYTAEPKIDGLSLSLRYENGTLVHAA
ncbi:MAG: NAD-dependent DNA ligase LigA, partial [Pseudomonadota bacterium]|nr:NAD-dependent DNA ligase LigA [Pseudomonadota bacterium]